MFKFLLIVFIVGYVLFKGLGFFINTILGGPSMQRPSNQPNRNRQPSGTNLRVDHVPNNDKTSKKNFKGGEYVDFEELD
ncbi:MAG TPA: hypothetical protein PKL31_05670 [Fulvivirga sp.]|nr:hypothetical protein [Fulvivirga sp.]